MERLKKYFVGLLILLVVVAAIITAVQMSSDSEQLSPDAMMGSAVQMNMPMSGSRTPMTSTDAVPMAYDEQLEKSIAGAPVENGEITASVEKKEIKNGNLSMRVHNADRAMERVAQIAAEHDGEVYASNFYQDAHNIKNGTVEVRVPVEKFATVFEALKSVATVVVGESTYGQDVTLAYRDLQARLKNKQAEEQAFLTLLERSGDLADVINVTREVSRVRGEIEQLQAQITYMSSQTDHATITISMTEDENVTFSDQWRPLQVAKETINGLLSDVQGFVNFVIVLVIRVIPIMFLYGVIVWIFYIIVRGIMRRIHHKKDSDTVQH